MNRIELNKVEHPYKVGDNCKYFEPNITEDSVFVENNEIIGFYIKDISLYSIKASEYANIANNEFLSKNVPKKVMSRSVGIYENKQVKQFSTILGSIQARPHMRRPYNSISSVHNKPTARNFVKSMWMLAVESEKIIEQIAPNIYNRQKKIFDKYVDKKWRFGNLFTSSISNFNIAAGFHKDGGNIKDCVNVIITKRKDSTGGNTTVPDYNATVGSADNSMLVYPAWRNLHGVTPIVPTADGGYRNTLIFYALKSFLNNETA